VNGERKRAKTPVNSLIEKADEIMGPDNTSIEDWRDALDLYKAAAKLNSGEANHKIAIMYRSGNYMKKDLEKSLFYFKEAIRLGYFSSAA